MEAGEREAVLAEGAIFEPVVHSKDGLADVEAVDAFADCGNGSGELMCRDGASCGPHRSLCAWWGTSGVQCE